MKKLTLLCVAIWLVLAGFQMRAQASDEYNRLLGGTAADIYGQIDHMGYDYVGVLPFQLKARGNQTMTWQGATIQRNMASRLEQALVANMDHVAGEQHTKIVFDAWDQARSHNGKANFEWPESRKHLFRHRYKTPVGGNAVKVDAFISGVVEHDNYKTTKLTLLYCTPEQPQWQLIKTSKPMMFQADTHTLASMGRGFCIDRKLIAARSGVKHADILAALSQDDVWSKEQDQKQQVKHPVERIKHEVDPSWQQQVPVELAIHYDGHKQAFHRDHVGGAMNMTVADPKAGQTVTLFMRNLTNETLSVVLSINGMNTLYGEQATDPVSAAKWVLEPHQVYQVRGIYGRHGGVTELKGHGEYESKDALTSGWMQKDMEGLIHMYVYRNAHKRYVSNPAKPQYQAKLHDDKAPSIGFDYAMVRGGTSVTAKGTFARDSSTASATSWKELSQKIADRAVQSVAPRGFMLPSGNTKSAYLKKMKVGYVEHIATLIVRYYSTAEYQYTEGMKPEKGPEYAPHPPAKPVYAPPALQPKYTPEPKKPVYPPQPKYEPKPSYKPQPKPGYKPPKPAYQPSASKSPY